MQLKKITLITLFTTILLICSLSTISAANNTINSTSTGGIAQGITDTGTGDTLFLQPGTYNKTNQDTNITINKNITIQGNGSTDKVIIDAQKLSKTFNTNNNINVIFINITFINANTTIYGGVIYNNYANTTMAFINCSFTNNSANSGSAIYTTGNVTVSDSTFTNNRGGNGGVINNGGGAIFTIIDSNFTNNYANIGMIINTGVSTLNVFNCNFDGNNVTHGGAISTEGYLNVYDSNFTNNTARNGGAIYLDMWGTATRNIIVSGSIFTNNSATNDGGAIYHNARFSGITANNNIIITNNTFNNNTAEYNGGVIFNNGSSMSISGNTMISNSAGLGQMIYNNGTMGVLNLTFIDNSTWVVKNGSTITLYATLTDDMGNTVTAQNISFYLNGVFFENVTAIEGKANITFTVPSSTGDISVSGVYAGNGAYNILISNGLLKVRISTNITISVPKEVKVGDTITLESKLTDENGNPIAGATVDFYVDGVKVGSGVTDSNGIAKLNYTFNKAGKHNIIAKFPGDNTYLAGNATNQTTVSKIKTNLELKTDKDTITATLTDENGTPLANKEITITVNGKTYTKTTNSKGQAIIKYPNAWDYKVTANFAGDNQYAASKATAPKRTPAKITIKKDRNKITATLTDKNGKPIAGKKLTFRVKGVIIGVGITDSNGQVVIYYKNANKKAVTVSFEGDNEYAPSSATSTPESDNVQTSGKVAMKNTGIPIITVLLALIASMGLLTLRKRE